MRSLSLLIVVSILTGCEPSADRAAEPATGSTTETTEGPNTVEILATEYAFAAPDTIPAGWTQFNMKNRGEEEHFLLINPIPEGATFETMLDLAHFLQGLHDSRDAGELQKAEIYEQIRQALGPPTENVPYRGGPGLISSGEHVTATTFLDPGSYVIECYVRTADGVQHNTLGMIRKLVVTMDTTDAAPPVPDTEIVLTNDQIDTEPSVAAGKHTFSVRFEEHPTGYIGNDVHLFRIDESTEMDEVAQWVDVFEPAGMESPAPVEFVGGTQELPAGETAYFTVDLEPGEYAWIAELDEEMRKSRRLTVN